MVVTVLAFVLVLLICLDYLYKKTKNGKTCKMPGPVSVPIFGSAYLAAGVTPDTIFSTFSEISEKYGKTFKMWILHHFIIITSDAKNAEIILSSQKHITKHMLYMLLKPWLGTGLLLSTGTKWKSRRRILTPAFHFQILEQFVEIFDQQSCILVERLKEKSETREEFDLQPYVCLATLDILAETAMGTKVHAQTDQNCAYVKAVSEITKIMAWRFLKIQYAHKTPFGIFVPKMKKRQEECINTMHKFTDGVIENRRNALLTDTNQSAVKRMALLDVLLQSSDSNGKPLTNDDIREEVNTFMFAGHDTTTTAVCFTLYLISRHSDVQRKICDEIRNVCGDAIKTQKLTYNYLQGLKYMECVIKESLRMYPPVPFIGRHIEEDFQMNGYTIPAGTDFLVTIFGILRNPEIFPNPESFQPERHSRDNPLSENISNFAYIPFSAGPRNCIGQKFAMLEMKTILARILLNYELLPLGEELQLTVNIVLRSKNGFIVGIKPRDI